MKSSFPLCKTASLAAAALPLVLFSGALFAQAAAPQPNKGDTAWLLTCAAIVIFMTLPGLGLFYGGLVRSKNMLSVLMQCVLVFALVAVLWTLYGYSLAFTTGNAFFGGWARHGGGAFSGKDPSKVDRSAAYAGRYVAKNIVAAGLASRALIQVSYAIGVARPTSVMVNTFGTGRVSDAEITKLVLEHFDLRPKGIIQMLDLLRPIYEKTAAYGHFGREEPEFSWEATDKALMLAEAAGTEPVASVA